MYIFKSYVLICNRMSNIYDYRGYCTVDNLYYN